MIWEAYYMNSLLINYLVFWSWDWRFRKVTNYVRKNHFMNKWNIPNSPRELMTDHDREILPRSTKHWLFVSINKTIIINNLRCLQIFTQKKRTKPYKGLSCIYVCGALLSSWFTMIIKDLYFLKQFLSKTLL